MDDMGAMVDDHDDDAWGPWPGADEGGEGADNHDDEGGEGADNHDEGGVAHDEALGHVAIAHDEALGHPPPGLAMTQDEALGHFPGVAIAHDAAIQAVEAAVRSLSVFHYNDRIANAHRQLCLAHQLLAEDAPFAIKQTAKAYDRVGEAKTLVRAGAPRAVADDLKPVKDAAKIIREVLVLKVCTAGGATGATFDSAFVAAFERNPIDSELSSQLNLSRKHIMRLAHDQGAFNTEAQTIYNQDLCEEELAQLLTAYRAAAAAAGVGLYRAVTHHPPRKIKKSRIPSPEVPDVPESDVHESAALNWLNT